MREDVGVALEVSDIGSVYPGWRSLLYSLPRSSSPGVIPAGRLGSLLNQAICCEPVPARVT